MRAGSAQSIPSRLALYNKVPAVTVRRDSQIGTRCSRPTWIETETRLRFWRHKLDCDAAHRPFFYHAAAAGRRRQRASGAADMLSTLVHQLSDLVGPIGRGLDLVEAGAILPDGEHDKIADRLDSETVAALRVEHLAELAADAEAGLENAHCSVSTPATASKSTVKAFPLVKVSDVP